MVISEWLTGAHRELSLLLKLPLLAKLGYRYPACDKFHCSNITLIFDAFMQSPLDPPAKSIMHFEIECICLPIEEPDSM